MLKVDEFFFPKLTNRPSKSSDAGEGTKAERRSKAGFCAGREWDEKKRRKRFGFRWWEMSKVEKEAKRSRKKGKRTSVEWRVERRDWSAIERKKERKKAQRFVGN